jgi:hypothetical protein
MNDGAFFALSSAAIVAATLVLRCIVWWVIKRHWGKK